MLDELPAGKIVLAFPIDAGVDAMLDEKSRAAIAEGIHHRLRSAALTIGLELRPRPVEISGMKEVRQTAADFLVRSLDRASTDASIAKTDAQQRDGQGQCHDRSVETDRALRGRTGACVGDVDGVGECWHMQKI